MNWCRISAINSMGSVCIYAWNPFKSFVLPLKEGLFQLKQGTFGFQVYISKNI